MDAAASQRFPLGRAECLHYNGRTQPDPPMHTAPSPSVTETRTAPLQEIFSSLQGEGLHVGKRQIFVRFAHCHLKCTYCDTPMTSPSGQVHLETPPGSGQVSLLPNPMPPEALVAAIESLLPLARHHSVSFTGGEPLLYHRFLKEVLPAVRRHVPTYIETSGTQPEFMSEILPWSDIVAMDIKLPSATGEAPRYEHHAEFYRRVQAAPQTELFIKLVFNERIAPEELAAVRDIVTDRRTPIILQPVTDLADRTVHVDAARILAVETELSRHFEDVRVIPQTHKMIRVL